MKGLKLFNQDVAVAKTSAFNCVSQIRRGDSDGELVFSYTHERLAEPLQIQALAQDADSYPKNTNFMVFTSSDGVSADIILLLEKLSPDTENKTVSAAITLISDRLSAKLSSAAETREDMDIDSDNESSSSDMSFLDNHYYHSDLEEEDDNMDDDLISHIDSSASSFAFDAASLKNLHKDLASAQSAGLSIGLIASEEGQPPEIISLSLQASKLGISEEALEAWGVRPCEYLVLLARFPMGYPSLAEFMSSQSDQTMSQFRFGKCAQFKPSLMSARLAFDSVHDAPGDLSALGDDNDAFADVCMSNSINALLAKEFVHLLVIRRKLHVSWEVAQNIIFQRSRGEHHDSPASESGRNISISAEDDKEPLVTTDTPANLHGDFAMDAEKDFSICLVSMQFALHRFAKCTRYCMVCHQIIHDRFEAVKPYVCSNTLCLYQYLSLGFGSTIEHEVMNNHYVVDILISFFYACVRSNKVKQFPSELGLKAVNTGSSSQPEEHIMADICLGTNEMRFALNDVGLYNRIKKGDWVFVVMKEPNSKWFGSMAAGGVERHLCRVVSIGSARCTFEVIPIETDSLQSIVFPEQKAKAQPGFGAGWRTALVFQFSHEVDDLKDDEKQASLLWLMHRIPSVLDMRLYLSERPGRRLRDWSRLNKSAVSLLHWIIASNRSFIVLDDEVPLNGESGRDGISAPLPANRVKGMGAGWMQFRFVQGSPEKEKQFLKELSICNDDGKGESRLEGGKKHPTLFAWHGSPMANWHSIIRTGLHFQDQLHGRAYGHGVYFSQNFDVSSGYIDRYGTGVKGSGSWPNSHLRPTSAISICEIINQPENFVSKTPHYVVNNVDWIQCRYLFISVNPTSSVEIDTSGARPTPHGQQYLVQDPDYTLVGPEITKIEIPIPSRYFAGTNSNEKTVAIDANTVDRAEPTENKGDDLNVLLGHKTNSTTSPLGPQKSTQMASQKPSQKSSQNSDFRPGQLDLSSLRQLPDPTWASPVALRSLTRDVKVLERTQSQGDIYSLGWCIDFGKINNPFQLIAEIHSFDETTPLAQDMKAQGHTSIVLELRFGASYPISPPFVRVIRPRFIPFSRGGGGHVTAGGAICSEMLTNAGWSPALGIEKILLQVRLGLCDMDPPARLENATGPSAAGDYGIGEAVEAYRRSARAHGWSISSDIDELTTGAWSM